MTTTATLAGIRSPLQRLSVLVTARLRPDLRVASVPCGMMDEVLLQPVVLLNGISTVGADAAAAAQPGQRLPAG